MALDCTNGKAATYTAATTATVVTGTPADYIRISWAAADEGSGYVVTVYVDGTIIDGGSVSGKVGEPVRIKSGANGTVTIPIRGASQVALASSSAWGTATVRLGDW